jgi:hypothetical protein
VKDAIAAAQGRGEFTLKPVSAAAFRVNEKDRAWVDRLCTPQPIATMTDPSSITGARDRIGKKTYVRAKGYPSVPFDTALAKFKDNAAWKTYEMTAGHDAMVDEPERLSEILIEVS